MRQYQIETIEDLIRVYQNHDEEYFKQLLKQTFDINSEYVEELNELLRKWTNHLTSGDICRFSTKNGI